MTANAERGEATIHVEGREVLLRPTFDALVKAEQEIGPLFALVERAGEGQLRLSEIAALLWYCQSPAEIVDREAMGDAVLSMGLARVSRPLKSLLAQILRGG